MMMSNIIWIVAMLLVSVWWRWRKAKKETVCELCDESFSEFVQDAVSEYGKDSFLLVNKIYFSKDTRRLIILLQALKYHCRGYKLSIELPQDFNPNKCRRRLLIETITDESL